MENLLTFYPSTTKEWRQWLRKNHKSVDSVWVIFYRKETKIPTVSWSDAVDQALCFGWIDGKRISLPDGAFQQLFTKRKSGSTWSKINKDKVERLIAKKQMTAAGHEAIRIAKENGSWSMLDDVEALIIPPDLEKVFKRKPKAAERFHLLSKSTKKLLLSKLMFAKGAETRKARIRDITTYAKPAKAEQVSKKG